MFTFLHDLLRFLQPAALDNARVPRDLFESAGARAGTDPHHAEELRCAAQAALRVVR